MPVSARSVVGAPLHPRTYLNCLHLALSFPLGVAYFVVLVTGFSLAISLAVLLVGLPLLVVMLLVVRGLAAGERLMARRLLGADLHSPTYRFLDGSITTRIKGLVLDTRTWTECLYLLVKFPLGVGAFVVLVTGLTTSLAFLATPLYYDSSGTRVGVFPAEPIKLSQSVYLPWGDLLVGVEFATTVSQWAVDSLADALVMSAIGVVAVVVVLNVVNALAWVSELLARALIGTTPTLTGLRDTLEQL